MREADRGAQRYATDPKTVAKWKKRGFVNDLRTGPTAGKDSSPEHRVVPAPE